MITKGVIVNITEDKNIFMVRLPVFESVGNSSKLVNDNSPSYEAAISYTPGILMSYQVGDIVWVGFEDNNLDKLVILGKLYQGEDVDPISFAKLDKLYVNSNTELNGQIKMNGIDLSTIGVHDQAINNLTEIINEQAKKESTWGDWVAEVAKDNLVLNFHRKRKINN